MPTATFQRPTESIYFSSSNPPVLAALNLEDTQLYLERLGIDPELAHSPPSFDLLSLILIKHHQTIPYDSSAVHVSDWNEQGPITWRNGRGMELGRGNFERIVGKDKEGKQKIGKNGLPMGGGGYCFALNQSCAALLRGFGFRVSEIPARVFLHRGRDPTVAGTLWSPTTHSASLVDWPESASRNSQALPPLSSSSNSSQQRYFLDVGFGGGGSPILIPFHDGATAPSLSKSESFLIRFEKMPMGEVTLYADPPDGFTLYRRVVDAGVEIKDHRVASDGPGYWTPCIHCSIASLSPEDLIIGDFFNSKHPTAPWANIFLVSILLPNGARRTLCHGIPAIDQHAPTHPEGKKLAKLYSKEGIKGPEYDIEWVVFETRPIRDVLEREFNFRF